MPYQESVSKPGKPCSATVGISGASGARVSYRFSNVAHTTAPGTNGVTILGSLGTLVWSMNDTMQYAPAGGPLSVEVTLADPA